METRTIYVSYDNDNIIKLWKNRPAYNESEDDFSGKPIRVHPDTFEIISNAAKGLMEMGTSRPFFICSQPEKDFSMIRYSDLIHDNALGSREDILSILKKGFRQIIRLVGKESTNELYNDYEGCPFVGLKDFCFRIIKDFDGDYDADTVIDGIFANLELKDIPDNEDEELFLEFYLHTKNMYVDCEEYGPIEEVVENNVESFFGLIKYLRTLEDSIIIVDKYDLIKEDREKTRIYERFLNLSSFGILSEDNVDLYSLLKQMKNKFGFQARKNVPTLIDSLNASWTVFRGFIFGSEDEFGVAEQMYSVIGFQNPDEDTIQWWVACTKDHLPFNEIDQPDYFGRWLMTDGMFMLLNDEGEKAGYEAVVVSGSDLCKRIVEKAESDE